jgi:hypothetical protein
MPPSDADFLFYTTVDDELYDELALLAGQRIAHLAVWEDSMVDALAGQAGGRGQEEPTPATFDMDLYLQDGVYFELYSVAAYPEPDAEPLTDRDALEERLHALVAAGGTLGEVAVDPDDALVLVLAQGSAPVLYLAVGGWVLEEWDELPV